MRTVIINTPVKLTFLFYPDDYQRRFHFFSYFLEAIYNLIRNFNLEIPFSYSLWYFKTMHLR